MGRRAIDALLEYKEVNLFLRGIVPLLGYRTSTVYYDRVERFAGVSKYPLKRMLAIAIDGITSFSVVPLRLITLLGFVVSVFSFFMIVWVSLDGISCTPSYPVGPRRSSRSISSAEYSF